MFKLKEQPYICYDGSMSVKSRQAAIKKYNTDPACRIMLISNVGSTGLNVTAASVVIIVSNVWSGLETHQIFGRVDRPGQCRDVVLYNIVAPGGIDLALMGYSESKASLSDRFLMSRKKLQQTYLAVTAGSADNDEEVQLGSNVQAKATKVASRKRKGHGGNEPGSSDNDRVPDGEWSELGSPGPSKRMKMSSGKRDAPVKSGSAAKAGPSADASGTGKAAFTAKRVKDLRPTLSEVSSAQKKATDLPGSDAASSSSKSKSQATSLQSPERVQLIKARRPQTNSMATPVSSVTSDRLSSPPAATDNAKRQAPTKSQATDPRSIQIAETNQPSQAPSTFRRRPANARRFGVSSTQSGSQAQVQMGPTSSGQATLPTAQTQQDQPAINSGAASMGSSQSVDNHTSRQGDSYLAGQTPSHALPGQPNHKPPHPSDASTAVRTTSTPIPSLSQTLISSQATNPQSTQIAETNQPSQAPSTFRRRPANARRFGVSSTQSGSQAQVQMGPTSSGQATLPTAQTQQDQPAINSGAASMGSSQLADGNTSSKGDPYLARRTPNRALPGQPNHKPPHPSDTSTAARTTSTSNPSPSQAHISSQARASQSTQSAETGQRSNLPSAFHRRAVYAQCSSSHPTQPRSIPHVLPTQSATSAGTPMPQVTPGVQLPSKPQEHTAKTKQLENVTAPLQAVPALNASPSKEVPLSNQVPSASNSDDSYEPDKSDSSLSIVGSLQGKPSHGNSFRTLKITDVPVGKKEALCRKMKEKAVAKQLAEGQITKDKAPKLDTTPLQLAQVQTTSRKRQLLSNNGVPLSTLSSSVEVFGRQHSRYPEAVGIQGSHPLKNPSSVALKSAPLSQHTGAMSRPMISQRAVEGLVVATEKHTMSPKNGNTVEERTILPGPSGSRIISKSGAGPQPAPWLEQRRSHPSVPHQSAWRESPLSSIRVTRDEVGHNAKRARLTINEQPATSATRHLMSGPFVRERIADGTPSLKQPRPNLVPNKAKGLAQQAHFSSRGPSGATEVSGGSSMPNKEGRRKAIRLEGTVSSRDGQVLNPRE